MGVVGLAENKANSAQLELELGLSLAISQIKQRNKCSWLPGWLGQVIEVGGCLKRMSLFENNFNDWIVTTAIFH